MDSNKPKFVRKRLFVDEMQRQIIVRTIFQWYFYMSAILLVVCLGATWMNPNTLAIKHVFSAFVYFAPGVVASLILLPLFVYDMLVSTNRVAGPVFRFRKELRALMDGKPTPNLKFREGDSFQELADDYNELVVFVNQLQEELRQQSTHSQDEKMNRETNLV